MTQQSLAVAGDRALVATTRDERVKEDNVDRIIERATLTVYDLADGKVLQQVELPAPVAQAGIAVAGGTVFLTCLDGSIFCLR